MELYSLVMKSTTGKKSAIVMLVVFVMAGFVALGRLDASTLDQWTSFAGKPLDVALIIALGHKVVRWLNKAFKAE